MTSLGLKYGGTINIRAIMDRDKVTKWKFSIERIRKFQDLRTNQEAEKEVFWTLKDSQHNGNSNLGAKFDDIRQVKR